MASLDDRVSKATTFVQSNLTSAPKIGIVLGTGAGILADSIRIRNAMEYSAIPSFPQSTALGHKGQLIEGELDGIPNG